MLNKPKQKWDGKWRIEKVSPPEQHKLPATDAYRENYDRIFGKKEPECDLCEDSGQIYPHD